MMPDQVFRIRSIVLASVGSDSLAAQFLDNYLSDVDVGLYSPCRLFDFLRGLYAAGSWSSDDQDAIEHLFFAAYPV